MSLSPHKSLQETDTFSPFFFQYRYCWQSTISASLRWGSARVGLKKVKPSACTAVIAPTIALLPSHDGEHVRRRDCGVEINEDTLRLTIKARSGTEWPLYRNKTNTAD